MHAFHTTVKLLESEMQSDGLCVRESILPA